VGAALIGASALLAGYGFVHVSLPDEVMAFPMLLAGVGLVGATWRIEHGSPH
jgi:hypothetical protein